MSAVGDDVVRVAVEGLVHIEGFSEKRVAWLVDKIRSEAVWTRPLSLDEEFDLVLDGQHRMEAAKILGLLWVPAVRFRYSEVEVWSLRPKYSFTYKDVTERALAGDIYPYKTVKHRFARPPPDVTIDLKEMML